MGFKIQHLNYFVTVISVDGKLDGSNYLALINAAKKEFGAGTEKMVLDLNGCDFMSSAGIVALHNIVMIARGEKPVDTDQGWGAIHAASMDKDAGKQKNFVLAGLQPQIISTLEKTGLVEIFEIFDDRDQAVASYDQE